MTESFRQSVGRKVISRTTAQHLGSISHLLLDIEPATISGIVVGKGKKARIVPWGEVSGFGPDALMVSDESALREPRTDRERLGAEGGLELLAKRVLTETGNEIGALDDVTFDPATGALLGLQIAEQEFSASAFLGSGSYAVVLRVGGGCSGP